MNPINRRRISIFAVTLLVLGSVFFSRATAPEKIAIVGKEKNSGSVIANFFNRIGIGGTKEADTLPPEGNNTEVTPAEISNKTPNLVVPPPASKKNPTLLTESEIFRLQHPDYYLDYLKTIEGHMIADGFLAAGSHETFTNEAQILQFWREKGFNFFRAKGILSDASQSAFLRGIEEVKRLHAEEVRSLQELYQNTSAEVIKEKTSIGSIPPWVKAFAEVIQKSWRAETAKAQLECFQEGASVPGVGGINLIAPCCNCNVLGAPVGCLNLLCQGQSAIFDQTTFICGCG